MGINDMREKLAESEYKLCASCAELKIKWEHLKNPKAREAFYDKADLFLATETETHRIAVVPRDEPPIVAQALENTSKEVANELVRFQHESGIEYYKG